MYETDEGERIGEDREVGTGERGVGLGRENEADIAEVGVEERGLCECTQGRFAGGSDCRLSFRSSRDARRFPLTVSSVGQSENDFPM